MTSGLFSTAEKNHTTVMPMSQQHPQESGATPSAARSGEELAEPGHTPPLQRFTRERDGERETKERSAVRHRPQPEKYDPDAILRFSHEDNI